MEREILFRAKHIHAMDSNEYLNGRWIHGYLSDKNYINDKSLEGEFLIDEDTICQYTGLTDKNGKKIFEGDILRHADETILKTVWNDRKYGFAAQCVKGSVLLKDCKWGLWEFESDEVEVIGNVFDNPELLGGTK
jgi:uncharacterized phage protein (TIGR01671 family)|nr:MAG TPA: YopX protein [Caudoviricetes sp.]